MSVVIRTIVKNEAPALLGDLLISGIESDQILHLPTLGGADSIFPPGSGFVPLALRQKANLMSSRLAVGWAGDEFAAKIILKRLLKETEQRDFSPEDFEDFFSSMELELGQMEVSFCGFYYSKRGPISFQRNCAAEAIPGIGEASLIGSGASQARELLMQVAPQMANSPKNLNSTDKAVLGSALLAANLLALEVSTASTVSNYYGAGYEIVYGEQGRCKKYDKILYLILEGTLEDSRCGANPSQIVKYDYFDDFLFIRVFTMRHPITGAKLQRPVARAFVVPPIHRELTEINLDRVTLPTISYDLACTVLALRSKDGLQTFSKIESFPQSKLRPIQFLEAGSETTIGINQEFIRKFMEDCLTGHRAKKLLPLPTPEKRVDEDAQSMEEPTGSEDNRTKPQSVACLKSYSTDIPLSNEVEPTWVRLDKLLLRLTRDKDTVVLHLKMHRKSLGNPLHRLRMWVKGTLRAPESALVFTHSEKRRELPFCGANYRIAWESSRAAGAKEVHRFSLQTYDLKESQRRGELAFTLRHADADWISNEKQYSFPSNGVFGRGPIIAKAQKVIPNILQLAIMGPLGHSWEYARPLTHLNMPDRRTLTFSLCGSPARSSSF